MKVSSINNDNIESSGALVSVKSGQWSIALNQAVTGEYLQTPSLTFNEVILDFSADTSYIGTNILDARTGLSNSQLILNNGGAVTVGSYWGTVYLNGVQKPTSSLVIPNNTRSTLRLVGSSSGTNILKVFTNYTAFGGTFLRGVIYGLKLLNQGVVVANYEIANGTVNDISGKGNNATLNGGIWQ
jgi:hypothetical protein